MEKNGEFHPEKETETQKKIQTLIVKTADSLDEAANQSKLGVKHNLTPATKQN